MEIEFTVAKSNLQKLIHEFSPLGELSNEAQTRFSFIDRVLQLCLGWDAADIKVEVYESGARTDYECGHPRALIVEAKKAGAPFKLPPKRTRVRVPLASLMAFDGEVKAAIEQVQQYGASRGVGPVAVSNGPQLIIFQAINLSGQAPFSGDALVFDGYEELLEGFTSIFEVLSKDGIADKRLESLFGSAIPTTLPQKLSSACLNYFEHKYSSSFQESLRNSASLVIEDLGRTSDLEKDFLESCYCESGPLTQYALVGRSLLAARYAALFPSDEVGSRIESVNPRKSSGRQDSFTEQVLQEALAKRPVVLVGDVGVGKTTFLKHLMQVSGKDVFSKSISIYFDLGNRATLTSTPRDALLDCVESTLRELGINISNKTLMESIYSRELSDYDTGFAADLKEINPSLFVQNRIGLLQDLATKREKHLRLVLEHIAKERKCQTVVIIDNADQRNFSVQQEAFLIAQELADSWSSLVFIALRPQTFHASKRSGTLSAYPTKIFVIPPPKLEDAIEKRLRFALRMAEGKVPLQSVNGITLHVDSLAKLISCLLSALGKNRELYEFIINISGGNIRLAVELVSRFLGSPNVESERIVQKITEEGRYEIPLHEFAKAALLGELAHFQEESSAATNLFALVYRDRREHFLSLLILGYLAWDGASTSQSDGFISAHTLVAEMQLQGFKPEQTTAHLQRLTRRKLIESTERRLLDTGEEVRERGLPESFRVTTTGAYHLKKWVAEFAYLEAMAFDTNVLDEVVRQKLLATANDDRLLARHARALEFFEYLSKTWESIGAKPYFDWSNIRQLSRSSFGRVERRLRDHGLIA